jgi:hypothetical protein
MIIPMKPIIKFILPLLFLTSCEKLVNIDIKEADNKIVLSGLICPDSTVIVQITKSHQVSAAHTGDLSSLTPEPMVVGDVRLFEDGVLLGLLGNKRGSYFELPGFKPSPGKSYRLEAESGEMKPVSATVTVPGFIPLDSFDTTRILLDNGLEGIRVSMRITDPAKEENYYSLKVTGTGKYYDYFRREYTDSIVTYPYFPQLNGKVDDVLDLDFLDVNKDIYLDQEFFLSDRLFEGKVFDMSFSFSSDDWAMRADTVLVKIDFRQVDKSYYQYAVSDQKYRQIQGNPFAEPVQVYTNVKDGFGIFSACNGVRKEFLLIWKK